MSLKKIVTSMLLAFVGLLFVMEIGPIIETGITGYAGTNTFVIAILGMAEWLIPVGALVGIFYGVFRLMGGKRD